MVWDRRFELLTSRTPCVRATELRQSQNVFNEWCPRQGLNLHVREDTST